MNKLNGGYIMIDAESSTLQADLKKAYESGRPVLYYENGKSVFGSVTITDNTYVFVSSVLYHRAFEVKNTTDGYDVYFDILTSYDGELTSDNIKSVVYNSINKFGYYDSRIAGANKYCITSYSDEDSIYYLYDDSGTIKLVLVDWSDLLASEIEIIEF